MDDLLQKYNDFMRLNNCRAEYLLSNGQTIDFVYKEENFIHLLGLHKLIDIQLIQLFNDKTNKMVQTKYIISRIKKGKLTDAMVRASVFYNDISERYENFSYDNLTTLNYTDAVINFNPSLINSKIKSDYLLFEERINKEYNHLGIRFLYNGIIIKHQKTEPTYTKTSLFLCEKRRFFMARREKGVVPIIYFEKERGKSF